MIKAITIENFKGISEPVRLELRPITLLFGQNSAGKSSLLHALIYAREVFERHNLDADMTLSAGDSLDLGGFLRFVHNHDHTKDITLRLEVDLSSLDLPLDSRTWSCSADGLIERRSQSRSVGWGTRPL
jgi:predicted ATPase